jgi:hypothetical protein
LRFQHVSQANTKGGINTGRASAASYSRVVTATSFLFLLFFAAACSSTEATPTPDLTFANRWEYQGYQPDGTSIKVFVRVLGPSELETVIDGVAAAKMEGGIPSGIRTFTFPDVAPGRHGLRIIGANGVTNLLTVWMPPATVPTLESQQRIKLKPGEGFRIKDSAYTVVFTGVLGDSRCPVDVTCIRAGEVTVHMTAYRAGAPAVEMPIVAEKDVVTGDMLANTYLITIHSVLPMPRADQPTDFSKYEIEASFTVAS